MWKCKGNETETQEHMKTSKYLADQNQIEMVSAHSPITGWTQ